MPFKDLQDFMRELEKRGLLHRVTAEVSRDLEITEIADRVVKAGGPALLFEKVAGSSYPVLINAFGSYERMDLALGPAGPDGIAEKIAELIDPSRYFSLMDKVKSLPRLARLPASLPVPVPSGPCQAVEEESDLDRLPVLQCWPGDAGRFLTLPLVFTVDPDTGSRNVGMYRMQVYDGRTAGMHWHLHKDGKAIYDKYRLRGGRMPVSVVLGGDPAMIYAATAPLPSYIDEILFAGFLRGLPVETVKCKTNDIRVPARAEFVLEGYVDVDETLRVEGPFGDHTGYYSLTAPYPVFHLELITRKKNPVYPATVVGKPPMEDCYLGKAAERIFLPLLRMQVPEIRDMSFPLEGVFHNCAIVSIAKRFPGHAKKTMYALWGMGQMMYTKMIVVVDESVNPHDYSAVAWKVFNNIDPRRDVVIADGPLDALDHSSPLPHYGSRMGIDATRTWPEEGHDREWPDEIVMDPEVKQRVTGRWESYGLEGILKMGNSGGGSGEQ
jgi:4-hydroxy-3-polyprenylbenzoate decarboxylase